MMKRQLRIERINAVVQEYLAAHTAAELLKEQTRSDPSYGVKRGWKPRGGIDFVSNLEATYIIRIYAEFEAGLRDYWLTFRRKNTRPTMNQLLNESIPIRNFTQDIIDCADEVREYRNFLVHDIEDNPSDDTTFTVLEAKKHLCTYTSRLDAAWR